MARWTLIGKCTTLHYMSALPEDSTAAIEYVAELARRDAEAKRAYDDAHERFMDALVEATQERADISKVELGRQLDRPHRGLYFISKRWLERQGKAVVDGRIKVASS